MELETLPATAFKSPAIALSGVVDYEMYTEVQDTIRQRFGKDYCGY